MNTPNSAVNPQQRLGVGSGDKRAIVIATAIAALPQIAKLNRAAGERKIDAGIHANRPSMMLPQ